MPRKTELSVEDKALREQLGATIRSLSAAHGLKPQDVAKIGGVSQAHQYRIESGETTPDAIYLFKVATHLGIPVDRLFASEQPQHRPSALAIHGDNNVVAGRDLVGYAPHPPAKNRRRAT